MKKQPLTDKMRASIARGWRKSGLSQSAYAATYSVTDRTLRAWVARWAPPCGGEATRNVVERTIERLRALVAGLDDEANATTEPAALASSVAVAAVPAITPAVPVPASRSASNQGAHLVESPRAVRWELGNI